MTPDAAPVAPPPTTAPLPADPPEAITEEEWQRLIRALSATDEEDLPIVGRLPA
jgi:hypothetical protein